jgi:hypothetical protein
LLFLFHRSLLAAFRVNSCMFYVLYRPYLLPMGLEKTFFLAVLLFFFGLVAFCFVTGSYNSGVTLDVCVFLFLAYFAILHMVSADFAAFSIFSLWFYRSDLWIVRNFLFLVLWYSSYASFVLSRRYFLWNFFVSAICCLHFSLYSVFN